MRDILTYVPQFKSWTFDMTYAARLAGAFAARLTGVYVCPSPMSTMPPYDAPQLLETLIQETRDVEELAAAFGPQFIAEAARLGAANPRWQVAEGRVPDVLAHIGNWHDVLVIGRNDAATWGSAPMLGSIVLGSHLPAIVVPPGCTTPAFERIALAWNGSPEAIRAIHAARPLLARARSIVVLRGAPRDTFTEIGWKPEFDLGDYLAREGFPFEDEPLDTAEDEAGTALLAAAARHRADLLVMGAYGRTRFSEWVFGGATRHALANAAIPVLMRH